MFAEFGPAPISLYFDLNTFEGPSHWVAKFRRSSGWLMVAEATIQSEHDILTTRLVVACDQNELAVPSFQALNLTQCHWHRVTECLESAPEILSELLLEEEGGLVRRWHREMNTGLAASFEAQEMRIAELEGRTNALVSANDARIADLRRRCRHPALSLDLRSTMTSIIRDIERENDELVEELALTRTLMREEAAEEEEVWWSRSDILVEVEPVHVVQWKCGGVGRGDHLDYAPPIRPVNYYFGGDISRAYRSLFPQSVDRYRIPVTISSELSDFAHPEVLISPSATSDLTINTEICDAEPVQCPAQAQLSGGQPPSPEHPKPPIVKVVPAPPPWTPERISKLSSMWLAGHSPSHIAKTLGGTSRNAVLGKAKNLGLTFLSGKTALTSINSRKKSANPHMEMSKSLIKLDSHVRRLKDNLTTLEFKGRKFCAGSKKYKRNEEERAVLIREIAQLQNQIAVIKRSKEV